MFGQRVKAIRHVAKLGNSVSNTAKAARSYVGRKDRVALRTRYSADLSSQPPPLE